MKIVFNYSLKQTTFGMLNHTDVFKFACSDDVWMKLCSTTFNAARLNGTSLYGVVAATVPVIHYPDAQLVMGKEVTP